MNELKRCPKCNNHPTIQLLKDIIHFHCNCGYHKAINCINFIEECSDIFQNINSQSILFNQKKIKINQGFSHLNSYFTSLKNELINKLLNIINEIESAYEQSYQRNKSILLFIQLLIDNYDNSSEMENCIFNCPINIYIYVMIVLR